MADNKPEETIANLGPCGSCGKEAGVKCSKCKKVYYCDRSCQKSDWKRHKLICVRIKNDADAEEQEPAASEPLDVVDITKLTCKVEVKNFGVFATGRIEKGERICYYDGTTKDARIGVRMRKSPNGKLGIVNAEQVYDEILESRSQKCLVNPSKAGLIKLASENKSGFGVGQWIQDYRVPRIQDCDSFPEATDELSNYQSDSLAHANCDADSSFWFIASKDIEAGAEIFVHYGFQYWLRKFMLESRDPEKRFFYYSLHDQSTQPFNLQKFYNYDDETCKIFLTRLIQVPLAEIEECKNVQEYLLKKTLKNANLAS